MDLPPGTGDVQLSLIQTVPLTGAVLVTTPSAVALADVRKAIEMFRQVNVEVLGVVENMSYFVCPHCHESVDIFGHGEGRAWRRFTACRCWGRSKLIRGFASAAIPASPWRRWARTRGREEHLRDGARGGRARRGSAGAAGGGPRVEIT